MSDRPIQGYSGKLMVGSAEVPIKDWHVVPDWTHRYLNSPRNKRNLAWISYQAANLNPGPIRKSRLVCLPNEVLDFAWSDVEITIDKERALKYGVTADEFDKLWKEAGG